MDRLVLAAAIGLVAVVVAAVMRRRRSAGLAAGWAAGRTSGSAGGSAAAGDSHITVGRVPSGRIPGGHIPSGHIPSGIAVAELVACGLAPPPAVSFIVVFTEETCRTCAAALQTARGPLGAGLAVIEVEYSAQSELQRRLGIDTVPTTVVVASDGGVIAGWSGKIDEAELQDSARDASNDYG